MKRLHRWGYGLVLVGLLVAPLLGAYPVFVMKVLCFALFASAFNLLLGYAGLLSFGHAAFLGGSAYLAGHAMKAWGWPPEVGLIAGTAAGALLGWVFGAIAIRRQGIYFSMITLALAQLVYFIAVQTPATGGEDGLQGVPRGTLFGLIDLRNDLNMYYVTVAIVVAAYLLIMRTTTSPFGQVLKGVRENEARATSLGYDANRVKLTAFVLSAALSGLAGSLKTLVLGFATLTDVHWLTSGQVILMTMIGGVGTLFGPVVGSTLVLLLEGKLGQFGSLLTQLSGWEGFTALGQSVTTAMGVMFIFCVLAFRRGIMGLRAGKRRPAAGQDGA
ncbi:branched-chain amino acid ABC transporter permease [Hydrogenophaga crocea]|uniref:Branched-chain amino acid ABC transporter permease n=1 Tax=Hydrogenophaga crocea TaxID=2716225 RepID=A0A6G8IJN2_9BURK|nr:branched-chain amino acid ABC transporter permease [Hydrogenophaga crocea]QIM53417.1 branched-chain amino acid ABC transporter permease [Hydrogenophaga crocea]